MTEPRFVEATGPDVESAIKTGLARLGASSKDVIVEVIEESSRGLFGIGGRPAKVRLTLLAPPAPPPAKEKPAEPAPRQEARKDQPSREQSQQPRSEGSDKSRPRKRKPRKKPAQSQPPVDDLQVQDDQDDQPLPDHIEPKLTAPAPDDEEARVAIETIQELLGKMEIQAKVDANYAAPADDNESGPLVLQVTGKDLGMLIGRRGETLASLQYVTRLIVSRELQRRANLVVDVEHYKARREKRLHSLALRMAKQATQRGRTVKLEPMPAYERRIIHLSLRDRTDVYTQSVGEGDSRKVTIVPVIDR
jgi:spoIIIJ-associated protein